MHGSLVGSAGSRYFLSMFLGRVRSGRTKLGVLPSNTNVSIENSTASCHLKPCQCPWAMLPLEAMLMSVVSIATKDHDGVCGPCCSVLLPEAMLVFMVHVTTKGNVDVCGMCCHLKLRRCL